MKTIAISIDETLLTELDRVASGSGGRRGGAPRGGASSRSALVRRAVAELLERELRRETEDAERRILALHRARLAREAAALIEDQAAP